MDFDKLNLPLRSGILAISLEAEEKLNNFIIMLLDIGVADQNRKAIVDKSNAFSISEKLKLLNDLGILIGDAYGKFQLLFEIRNQFMHSAKCNSFRMLKKELKAKLKKHCDSQDESDTESGLNNAYLNLYDRCTDVMADQLEQKILNWKARESLVIDIASHLKFIIDGEQKILQKIYDNIETNEKDIPEIILFKNNLKTIINDEICSIFHTDVYRQSLAHYNKIIEPKYMKSVLKMDEDVINSIIKPDDNIIKMD